jgi:general nucleoside transport system ATP-binding protein
VIPEDRHTEGLILPMSVTENVSLDRIREPEFSRHGLWLFLARIRAFAREAVEDYKIQVSSVKVPVRMLSGGNQQKIVLARVLSSRPRILIAAEPTRGLDVAATRYVIDQLVAARASGTGILLFSSDLDHVLSLADRVLVLFKGRIAGVLETRTATRDELGRYMAGVASTPSGDATERAAEGVKGIAPDG